MGKRASNEFLSNRGSQKGFEIGFRGFHGVVEVFKDVFYSFIRLTVVFQEVPDHLAERRQLSLQAHCWFQEFFHFSGFFIS